MAGRRLPLAEEPTEPGEVLDRVQHPGEVKGTGEVETLNDLPQVPDEVHITTLILYENKTSIEIRVCLRLDVVMAHCLHLHSVVAVAEAVATSVHVHVHIPQEDIRTSILSIHLFQLASKKAHRIMLQAVQMEHTSTMKASEERISI